MFVRKLYLCILYNVWPRSFVGEVDVCFVWVGCCLMKWASRAAVRNHIQMFGHGVKLAGVCIPYAQSLVSGSWSKHGGYSWGFSRSVLAPRPTFGEKCVVWTREVRSVVRYVDVAIFYWLGLLIITAAVIVARPGGGLKAHWVKKISFGLYLRGNKFRWGLIVLFFGEAHLFLSVLRVFFKDNILSVSWLFLLWKCLKTCEVSVHFIS